MATLEQIQGAAYLRWCKMIGALMGTTQGLDGFPIDRAVAAAAESELAGWYEVLSEGIATLENARTVLRTEAEERFGEMPTVVTLRYCETCETEFEVLRSDVKYCSDACRQKAYRERKREKEADDE